MTRRSIAVPGFRHGDNPIPAACRVGPMLVSGAIFGVDLSTGTVPTDAGAQCANIFKLMQMIVEAGGATMDDVVKVTAYLHPDTPRSLLNDHWVLAFPDPASRPARHTVINPNLPAGQRLQCDVMAMVTP